MPPTRALGWWLAAIVFWILFACMASATVFEEIEKQGNTTHESRE